MICLNPPQRHQCIHLYGEDKGGRWVSVDGLGLSWLRAGGAACRGPPLRHGTSAPPLVGDAAYAPSAVDHLGIVWACRLTLRGACRRDGRAGACWLPVRVCCWLVGSSRALA